MSVIVQNVMCFDVATVCLQGLVPYWAAEDKTRVFDSFAVESPAVPTMYSEMV